MCHAFMVNSVMENLSCIDLDAATPAGSAYDVLGVPQGATSKEIKSAYRKAALKLHPDVNAAVRH